MTDRTFDELLDAWMDLGPDTAPDRVADAARLEVATTRQTAIPMWWPPRRFPLMNTYAKVAVATAAVVVAAILGFNYLVAPNVGGPDGLQASPEPGESISADLPLLVDQEGALEPGTYVVSEVEPLRLAITVPAGWTRNPTPAIIWAENSTGIIWFGRVHRVYADPCDTSGVTNDIQPGVSELANALTALPGVESNRQNVSASGFNGVRIDLTAADPVDGWCGDDSRLWEIENGEVVALDPNGRLSVWIFDVSGDRLVVAGYLRSAATPEVELGVGQIVDSLKIEAP